MAQAAAAPVPPAEREVEEDTVELTRLWPDTTAERPLKPCWRPPLEDLQDCWLELAWRLMVNSKVFQRKGELRRLEEAQRPSEVLAQGWPLYRAGELGWLMVPAK